MKLGQSVSLRVIAELHRGIFQFYLFIYLINKCIYSLFIYLS